MASGDHSYTRRDVLGGTAAVAAGIAGTAGAGMALAADSRVAWGQAIEEMRRAEGVVKRLQAAASAPGLSFDAVRALEDRAGEGVSLFYAAMRRLFAVPAPDLAALGVKVVLVVDHEVATLTGGEACLAALKADAGRLLRTA